MSRIAIVGGGAIGLACAFELARREYPVTVIERGSFGSGTSSTAAGMLAPSSEVERTHESLIALQLDSLGRYPQFIAGIEEISGRETGYRDEGTLWASRHRDDELELDHLLTIQQSRGMSARRLTARETRALEPHLSPRVIGGLLVEGDTQVDGRKLVPALAAACAALGVELVGGTQVSRVKPSGGAFELSLASGDTENSRTFEQVVLAAGVWLEDGLVTPLPTLGMRPVKGQIVRLRGEPLTDHVLRTPDIYIIPRRDGELLLGASEEEMGWDTSATAGTTLDLLRYGFEVLPGIYDLSITELDVGLRPTVADHMPVIGESPTPGVYVASAHYRHGILLAPATAYWLAELIATGSVPSELSAFSVERFTGVQTAGVAR